MKTTAGELAIQLRKIADHLDSEPSKVLRRGSLSFHSYDRDDFLATLHAIPKPWKKEVDQDSSYPSLRVIYSTPAIEVYASVPQNKTCTLVRPAQPAVYECDPILSLAEESAL